jgi:hypothetical protein
MADSDFLNLALSHPSSYLSAPLRALWWLKKGGLKLGPEWKTAHILCQEAEGTMAYDQVHALAHWIEGDEFNTDYWYRRTGEHRASGIECEWDRLVGLLQARST